MKIFEPNLYLESVYDLDMKILTDRGIKNVFIDVDNTLVPYYQKEADDKVRELMNEFRSFKINIIIVSNNTEERVSTFCKGLGLPYYSMAMKPISYIYRKILKRYKLKKEETAFIGDQVLTDIVGANLAGLFSVLVIPIVDKDGRFTILNRKLEKEIIDNGKRNNKFQIGVVYE